MEISQPVKPRRMVLLNSVLLVLGLVVAIGIVHIVDRGRADPSKNAITKIMLDQYANEAFPSWSKVNPGKACPEKLVELDVYLNHNSTDDAWGHPIKLLCPPPVGAKGIGVTSNGEDGREGTPDDLKSWE
jgi:hypothetical protein